MASSPRMAMALLFSLALLFPSSRGSPVICEELPQDLCAFAISTASKRCVLESGPRGDGTTEYQCRTSEVVVERMSDWIETDECVRACGVDRAAVGISSDSLMEPQFASKLCSPACYQNCPNIVDLYFNLAAAEGVFLADLCAATRSNPRRSMVELLSSGAAPGPAFGAFEAAPPVASAPAFV
uniref:2-phospho-L-lactate guanylyltransferase n=1 Tax=Anthurium amnicola TaxID=1678845 RepID=A0A1D1YDH0_9ARAE